MRTWLSLFAKFAVNFLKLSISMDNNNLRGIQSEFRNLVHHEGRIGSI